MFCIFLRVCLFPPPFNSHLFYFVILSQDSALYIIVVLDLIDLCYSSWIVSFRFECLLRFYLVYQPCTVGFPTRASPGAMFYSQTCNCAPQHICVYHKIHNHICNWNQGVLPSSCRSSKHPCLFILGYLVIIAIQLVYPMFWQH